MARKPNKKSRKGLRKKVLDDEDFEEVSDRVMTNKIFPVDFARDKEGGCLFRTMHLTLGQTFCPNAEYCDGLDDELTEFRCLMRERFIYEKLIAGIGQMPVYYDARQRR
jgi:hypothetical protein